MQSGSPGFGGPESAIGLFCSGQIARRLGLPWRSGGGVADEQPAARRAGRVRGTQHDAAGVPGRRQLRAAHGRLARERASSPASRSSSSTSRSCASLREEFTPLEVDEASLAYGAHQEVGHGGHFLGAEHTLERFRDCFYRPLLSSTENFERWKRNGGSDSAERATAIWHAALEPYEPPPIDDDLREELEEYVARRRASSGTEGARTARNEGVRGRIPSVGVTLFLSK